MTCIQCQTKIKQHGSTNGQHNLCLLCGKAGWCFLVNNRIGRNPKEPQYWELAAPLQVERERAEAIIRAIDDKLLTLRNEIRGTEIVDVRMLKDC